MKLNIDWPKIIGKWSNREDLMSFLNSLYMQKLMSFVHNENKTKVIFPNKGIVFRAFKMVDPKDLKIVIIGQDPYHDGSATGLAFANHSDITRVSPSLKKIMERLEEDIGQISLDADITLETWASQGVLLLNTALTVEKGMPNSHKKPWDNFTRFIISYIAKSFPGTIFMMWGKEAQKYEVIDGFELSSTCYILKAEHPAYANRQHRMWECDHFIKANKIIEEQNGKEFCIEW